MSGHLRFCLTVFLLLGGLSTSPASSNPFVAFFNQAAAAETAPAHAPTEEECLPQPGKSTRDSRHWVYRFDGHRKCWFQAAEEIATVRKPVPHHLAKRHVATSEVNNVTPRKRKAAVDARAELLRSAQPETPQRTPPELKLADAASAPVPRSDRLTPDHPNPPQVDVEVDVEALLAAAPAASDEVAASVPPTTPVAIPMTNAGEDGPGSMASRLGVLLMALGFLSLLSSTRPVRWAAVVGPSVDGRMDSIEDEGSSSFALSEDVRSAGGRAGAAVALASRSRQRPD